jgi:putative oxidoreductase
VNNTSGDLAVLLLRIGLGVMLVTHGANKMVGSGGIEGTQRWFEALGLRPAWLHARLAAVTEIGAGVLMALGALTPAAGAAFVGLMTVAALTDHKGKGFFVFKGGWEYVGGVGLAAVAVVCAGPGRWSLDRAIGWQAYGASWAAAAAIVGAGAGVALVRGSRHAPALSKAVG